MINATKLTISYIAESEKNRIINNLKKVEKILKVTKEYQGKNAKYKKTDIFLENKN